MFRALSREQVVEIARLLVDKVARRLRPQRVEVRFTDEAVAHLADRGFDPAFGARPLRRTIQRLVENELSRMLLDGSLNAGDSVTVKVETGRLAFDVSRGTVEVPEAEPVASAARGGG